MTSARGLVGARSKSGKGALEARAKQNTASVNGNLAILVPLHFAAGPATGGTSTFAAGQTTVRADGVSVLTLTATVRDRCGNPVVGQSVTMQDDADGEAWLNVRGTVAGTRHVAAHTGDAVLTQTVALVASAADAAKSSLSLQPATAVADGNQAVTLVLQLCDEHANPVAGQQVPFAATGGNNL